MTVDNLLSTFSHITIKCTFFRIVSIHKNIKVRTSSLHTLKVFFLGIPVSIDFNSIYSYKVYSIQYIRISGIFLNKIILHILENRHYLFIFYLKSVSKIPYILYT